MPLLWSPCLIGHARPSSSIVAFPACWIAHLLAGPRSTWRWSRWCCASCDRSTYVARVRGAERISAAAGQAAHDLLAAAQTRLGRQAHLQATSGRPEREVVQAAEAADLLVVARDGDRSRLGPASLGPATRFVVDHAPCPILLVWPDEAPGVTSIPSPHPHPPSLHPTHLPALIAVSFPLQDDVEMSKTNHH